MYAHRRESPFFAASSEVLITLAEGKAPWAIPWPCLHEFYAVVTNPKFYPTPTPERLALEQIINLTRSPALLLLAETDRHLHVLHDILKASVVRGQLIHDAKIAAICLQHGVREFWSADRDFSRFPELKTVNPLL